MPCQPVFSDTEAKLGNLMDEDVSLDVEAFNGSSEMINRLKSLELSDFALLLDVFCIAE